MKDYPDLYQPGRIAALQLRVLVELRPHDPLVRAPHQVRPDDDAAVVVLETLSGVDAADLIEAGGSMAQYGVPGAPANDVSRLLFHGFFQSPMTTSSGKESEPFSGSRHFQQ